MINLLLLACKQLSELEKGQNVAYNNYRLSFRDFAKKLNRYRSSIDFLFFVFCFFFRFLFFVFFGFWWVFFKEKLKSSTRNLWLQEKNH